MKKTSGLDSYLSKHGFKLSPVHSGKNEGYSSLSQRAAFACELKKYTHIKRILEIGFNAGHTSELFLKSCPESGDRLFRSQLLSLHLCRSRLHLLKISRPVYLH